jgi:glutathionylspermidine synthase
MILSSKAILPVLYQLFPESPYLLRADFEPFGETYVSKPVHSREGANVAIVEEGETVAETGGEYGDGPRIYQEYAPLPDFGGRFAVVGSWMVNGYACGIGLREGDGPITTNTSRFLPHVFRKSGAIKPPTMALKAGGDPLSISTPTQDPLWDRWLDR